MAYAVTLERGPDMFIVKKKIKGRTYNYLVESKRYTDAKGRSRVKRVHLAYLGQALKDVERTMRETIEDAYANATGARKRKLARFRYPSDIMNDSVLWAEELAYKRHRRLEAPRRDVVRVLPHLPTQMLPDA
jgi:hypothetical protein